MLSFHGAKKKVPLNFFCKTSGKHTCYLLVPAIVWDVLIQDAMAHQMPRTWLSSHRKWSATSKFLPSPSDICLGGWVVIGKSRDELWTCPFFVLVSERIAQIEYVIICIRIRSDWGISKLLNFVVNIHALFHQHYSAPKNAPHNPSYLVTLSSKWRFRFPAATSTEKTARIP